MKSRFLLLPIFTLALSSVLELGFAIGPEAQAQGTGTGTPAAAAPSAAAPSAAAPSAPEKKPIPPGFEPIAGKEEKAESVSAPLLVVVAYGVFFLLTFGYVIHVVRRQKALSDEIAAVQRKLGGRAS